jgi:hypothetical protein
MGDSRVEVAVDLAGGTSEQRTAAWQTGLEPGVCHGPAPGKYFRLLMKNLSALELLHSSPSLLVSLFLDRVRHCLLAVAVLRSIKQWLIVSLLVIVIGAHWAVLQSAAWAGMLVSYSRGATVQEAWTKTFDGQHPCKLCKIVKTGQASEKKSDRLKIETKFEFHHLTGTCGLFPPRPFRHFTPVLERADASAHAPLLPPPRAA